MSKKGRRTLTILFLITLIFVILYTFNIFNLKNILHGVAENKVTNGNTTITTLTGKSLTPPKEFEQHNILLFEGDNIISEIISETTLENTTYRSIETIITTKKSIDDIFNYYSSKFSNSITTRTDKNAIIIGGNAQDLIKIIIENEKYKIHIEKR